MSAPGNWGRWGPDDERGALNLVDAEATRRGLSAVRAGEPISLGLPMRTGQGPVAGIRAPMQHFMTRDGGDYAAGLPEKPGYGYADDSIMVACHGTTHLDALSHVWRDGLMWNGYPAARVTSRGAARCGIEKAGPIVTRGLFLDFAADGDGLSPGEPIGVDRLDAAAEAAGLRPAAGDALIVRTGWLRQWREGRATVESWPGLDADCADWLADHDISVVGADNIGVEVGPSTVRGSAMPLHVTALRDLGIAFLELLDLEALAGRAVSELLLVVAPLNIVGGVGSPCAPVAVI
ncbi:cyclase family protein [Nonomuraea purpurea]|uniref:Cyclase family protein n=1 Tax=Nonomuraea purpurea TaxID=1849276 RepID=A0ABV8G157_9ACTN